MSFLIFHFSLEKLVSFCPFPFAALAPLRLCTFAALRFAISASSEKGEMENDLWKMVF
jgi:hypothetical protein